MFLAVFIVTSPLWIPLQRDSPWELARRRRAGSAGSKGWRRSAIHPGIPLCGIEGPSRQPIVSLFCKWPAAWTFWWGRRAWGCESRVAGFTLRTCPPQEGRRCRFEGSALKCVAHPSTPPISANPSKYSCPNHFAHLVPFLYRIRPHVQLCSPLESATVGQEQKICGDFKKRATIARLPTCTLATKHESQVTNQESPPPSRESQIINHYSLITTHKSRNF